MESFDYHPHRIQDDLRGLLDGEVRVDPVVRQIFASDASVYEIRPLGVIRPRGVRDVVAVVRYAASKGIPLHARGAGTSTAGGALGPGLVVDFSRYFHRVLESDSHSVKVQAGVVLERLNAYLARKNRQFGPDPANTRTTTIAGMIAVDASGSHWPRYGRTGEHVQQLGLVLADGHVISAGREPLVEGKSTDTNPRKRELIDRLVELFSPYQERITQRARESTSLLRGGYHLDGILGPNFFDLARLVVGSEGTLALITEARLSTCEIPPHHGMVLFLFDSLEKATHAALALGDSRSFSQPAACDLLDRRFLSLARRHRFALGPIDPDTNRGGPHGRGVRGNHRRRPRTVEPVDRNNSTPKEACLRGSGYASAGRYRPVLATHLTTSAPFATTRRGQPPGLDRRGYGRRPLGVA